MRAGVSTVQQTLTTEAANVLKLAVAEAQRRGHAQVTPLHVATTLLSGTTSILRQACIQSHLHIPQPPQCRNLELCFKVALDRLQTSTSTASVTASSNSSAASAAATNLGLQVHHHHGHHHHGHLQHQQVQQPALSNALVAALKRAQAHQRRGYPEQQQVPLLAVKVEMEQLIISILDDPSVSRVMREASFSSTQVKNSLEEALAAAAAAAGSTCPTPGSSSTCSAQARRILPAAGATASLVVNPSGNNVDRLRLKLGSLESYSSGGAGTSPINFQHSRTSSSANLIIPGLLVNQGAAGSGGGGGVRANGDQLSNVLLSMAIPPSISSSGNTGLGGRSSVDVGRVFEVLLKSKKRNPLLFGEQSPHGVAEEVMNRLEKGECEASLRNLRIVSPQFASIALGLHGKEEVEHKFGELVRAVETNLICSAGVVVYLGDLQWLVERPPPPPPSSATNPSGAAPVYCPVQHAVTEIEKLLLGQGPRVWLMAVASSRTYMKCQARHPCLDNVWGLQPLPISTGFNMSLRNSNTSTPNRFGSSSATVIDSPAVRVPAPGRWPVLPFKLQSEDEHHLENCCSECVAKYEQELHELEKKNLSSSDESSTTSSNNNNNNGGLPFWLKPGKESAEQMNGRSQKVKELQKKWSQACRTAHGALRNNPSLRTTEASCKAGTGGSSLPMSIPWLSLQPTGAKGTAPPQVTVHGHGKDVGSVCTEGGDDVLSTDIGLSLKPSATGRTEQPPMQQQKQESEVTVQTDLVLGRSGNSNLDMSSSNCSVSSGKLSPNLDVKNRLHSLVNPVLGFPAVVTSPSPEKRYPPVASSPSQEKRYPPVVASSPSQEKRYPPVASSPPQEKRYQEPQLPANTPLITANNGIANSFKAPPPKDLDFKALCKALADSVPWQRDAVDKLAATVLHCRSGAEKRRGTNVKCDTWLLLLGSDAMAKRKVARILAEQVFGSEKMFFRLSLRSQAEKVSRGQEREADMATVPGRGRTPLDRLADAVRSKPFSVVLLEDIEQADPRLKTALMRAAERGRLADSSGREVSVANLIVVMTSSIGEELLPQEKSSFNALELNEKTVSGAEIVGMKLLVEEAGAPETVMFKSGRVSLVKDPVEAAEVGPGAPKRKGGEDDKLEVVPKRCKVEQPRGMELDLNLPSDEANDGDEILVEEVPIGDETSSSGLKDDQVKLVLEKASEQLSKSFCSKMSGTVVFKPFSFSKLAELVVAEMNSAVSATSSRSLEVDSTLFKHLVAVVWEGQGKHDEFQRWVTQVLQSSISSLVEKTELPDKQHHVIKLVADTSESTEAVLHLPKRIKIGDGGT